MIYITKCLLAYMQKVISISEEFTQLSSRAAGEPFERVSHAIEGKVAVHQQTKKTRRDDLAPSDKPERLSVAIWALLSVASCEVMT